MTGITPTAESGEVERVAKAVSDLIANEFAGNLHGTTLGLMGAEILKLRAVIAAFNEGRGEKALNHAGNHTPGPWRYQEGADAYTHIVRAGLNEFIVQLPQDRSGKAEANARLIASAPALSAEIADLREALNKVVETCDALHASALANLNKSVSEDAQLVCDASQAMAAHIASVARAILSRTKGEGA